MDRTKKWQKSLKKNWKLWLVSFLLALVLAGRGLSAIGRFMSRPDPTSGHPAVTTPAAGG